ncbi:phosphoglycerate kinase PGKI [Besnoitia besnoiti]|uniref:Phosphoglycerate kinase n=1 Tax=Besnoitia besnoiti TaxID=94643 RepID=A0A2A9MKV0_BESBE|nr:phosphoglycerate kinase PGKI [Besnoitia besnoiti]PFH36313.1 phosphoglycerate kinase PGKI [Besnoitia besnoiti]
MLANKLGIQDVGDQLTGKSVLIRVDFNVPMKDGVVTDSTRVKATLPTLQYALSKSPRCIVLLSHAGRPDGRVQPKYSLKPVAKVLHELLPNRKIVFVEDCVGPTAEEAVKTAKDGEVLLMENVRFHVEEEGKGTDENGNKIKADAAAVEKFKAELTKLGDIYINDAFGTAHRAHASMVGVQVPIRAAGLLMKKELEYFSKALESPEKPFLAILGGAKVKDKIQLIENMLDRVQMMIIAGGMAFTFKKVIDNMEIGKSLYDEDGAKIVPAIMKKAQEKGVQIVLPVDFVCADKFENDANTKICDEKEGIHGEWMGVDCGPKTREKAREVILKAKTLVWNGPPGVFEMPNFAQGSIAFCKAVSEATKQGCITIVGGGDTAALVEKEGYASQVSHVSTGGGASLELLEGKTLPGVAALSSK